MVKLLKNEDKEKMLKAAREKRPITLKEGKITMTNFSALNRKATRQWNDSLMVLEEKNQPSVILHSVKNPSNIKGKRMFSDKEKAERIQEMLMGVLRAITK